MRTIIIFINLLFFNLTFAKDDSCYAKLTKGYKDSATFSVPSHNLKSNLSETLEHKMSEDAVNNILIELQCDFRVHSKNIQCARMLDIDFCRVDVSKGYFLIVKDFVDTVNIIFNRWD